MANPESIDLLFISLLILFLILVVLILFSWVLKHHKYRNLTELKISAGQPPLHMVIRTKPEDAKQLIDHLMDRFVFQVEMGPHEEGSTEECRQQNESASAATSNPSKSPNILTGRYSRWISFAMPSQKAKELASNSCSPSADQSQAEIHALQQQDQPQHASSSCQGASSIEINTEKKH